MEPAENASAKIPFEIIASADRTSKTVNDDLNTKWAANDGVNLFHSTSGTKDYVSDGEFGISAKHLSSNRFSGSLGGALTPGQNYDWYIFYPYDRALSSPENSSRAAFALGSEINVKQVQSGNDSKAHLAGKNFPMFGTVSNLQSDVVPAVTMSQLAGVVEVEVTNVLEDDITVIGIDFVAGEDIVGRYYIGRTDSGITYEPVTGAVSDIAGLSVTGGSPLQKFQSARFYLGVKPFVARSGSSLTVKVWTSSSKGQGLHTEGVNLSKDIAFSAGKIKTVKVAYNTPPAEPEEEKNLSREELIFRRLLESILKGGEDADVAEFAISAESDFAKYPYFKSEYASVMSRFETAYPFLFHIRLSSGQEIRTQKENASLVASYKIPYIFRKEEMQAKFNRIYSDIEEFYGQLEEGMSEAEMAYSIYHHLTKKTQYREFAANSSQFFGAISDGQALCVGYSLAYRMLMRGLGINTITVKGIEYGPGHMWNKILIDGDWYNVDATWDDNRYATEDLNKCWGAFFLTSDNRFYFDYSHMGPEENLNPPASTNTRFDSNKFKFRRNTDTHNISEMHYRKGFWFYTDYSRRGIYKCRFDGSEEILITKLTDNQSYRKRFVLGKDRIYYWDRDVDRNDVLAYSVTYSGEDARPELAIKGPEFANSPCVPAGQEYVREDGITVLRAEVALAKFKDVYFHGNEDYFRPEASERLQLLAIVGEAEKLIAGKNPDSGRAKALCRQIREKRKHYNLSFSLK